MKNEIVAQMELGFKNAGRPVILSHRQKRLSRAHWWFDRMRQIADRAFDWKPAASPRPEQIWMESVTR